MIANRMVSVINPVVVRLSNMFAGLAKLATTLAGLQSIALSCNSNKNERVQSQDICAIWPAVQAAFRVASALIVPASACGIRVLSCSFNRYETVEKIKEEGKNHLRGL